MRVAILMLAALIVAGCKPKPQLRATEPTHFVQVDGSGTSNCTEAEPCSLYRATTLIGGAIPPGALVLVRTGAYAQGQLFFKGSGTADLPIVFRFENGAYLTSTRVKPETWTQTAGYPHVYETAWNESGTWTVGTVAQRRPETWTPIQIVDGGGSRKFSLTLPPNFRLVYSLAAVEQQSGTFFASTTLDKVFVHMYHDGPPTVGDDLYLGSQHAGSVMIEGDFLEFENLHIEKTSGTGLYVRNSANGTKLRNVVADAAQVWLEGWNTVVDGITIGHVIQQGDPTGYGCLDSNPDFGMGECWNAYGDGRGLLIGKSGKAGGYQTIRNAYVHRGWNGMRIDGKNTIENCTVWGAPNHGMEASGVGFVIRNCQVLNTQDSLFMKNTPAGDFTIEQNIFNGAVYVTTSNDGRGGTAMTAPWRFQRNITPTLGMDKWAVDAIVTDCNVYMGAGDVWRVLTTNGIPGRDYRTLADVQANTPHEARSNQLAPTFWTSGLAFANFTTPWNAFDYRDPLLICGARVGPTTFYPASENMQ